MGNSVQHHQHSARAEDHSDRQRNQSPFGGVAGTMRMVMTVSVVMVMMFVAMVIMTVVVVHVSLLWRGPDQAGLEISSGTTGCRVDRGVWQQVPSTGW